MELKLCFEHSAQALNWVYRLWQTGPLCGSMVRARLAAPWEQAILELPARMGYLEFMLLLQALPVEELALGSDEAVVGCFVPQRAGYLTAEDPQLLEAARRPATEPVLPVWAGAPQLCVFGGDEPLSPQRVADWLKQQPLFAQARVQARYRGSRKATAYAGGQQDGKLMLLTALDETRQVMAGYYRSLNCFVLYAPQPLDCPFDGR